VADPADHGSDGRRTGADAFAPEAFDAAVRELEGSFNRLVRQYRATLTRQAEAVHPGLPLGAMKAFVAICHRGPLTPSDLAEHMMLDRAQISRVLKDLEGDGLIHREPDPRDRRSALLTATHEARARLDAVRLGPAGGGTRARLQHWDLEDVRALSALLRRFVDEREDPADDDACRP